MMDRTEADVRTLAQLGDGRGASAQLAAIEADLATGRTLTIALLLAATVAGTPSPRGPAR